VVLGRISAAMEVESQRAGPLLEGLAQQIDSAHDQRHGLAKPIASPAFHSGLIRVRFAHEIPKPACERIALPGPPVEIRECLPKSRREKNAASHQSIAARPLSNFR